MTADDTVTASTSGTTFATVTTRDVVRVEGPDAVRFLQGQISQDVDALAVNTSTWSFVLAPQGKVDGWVRVTKVAADAFLLDIDAGHGEALAARLSRFKIRTAADITTHTWPCVAVRGPDAPRGDVPAGTHRLALAAPDHAGYDLLGPDATVPDGITTSDDDALTVDRIVHGVPAMGAELTEATIPAEIGQWIIDASVSFTKGCFVGQELVARIDSRGGNVPRNLRVLRSDAPMRVGEQVHVGDDVVGTVTSAAVSEPVALAAIARRVDADAEVAVHGRPATAQSPATVDPPTGHA